KVDGGWHIPSLQKGRQPNPPFPRRSRRKNRGTCGVAIHIRFAALRIAPLGIHSACVPRRSAVSIELVRRRSRVFPKAEKVMATKAHFSRTSTNRDVPSIAGAARVSTWHGTLWSLGPWPCFLPLRYRHTFLSADLLCSW